MNKAEFSIIAATLKTVYPWAKLLENEQAIEIWYRKLNDISADVMGVVVDRWIETRTQPPTIADLRAEAARVKNGDALLWSDGWEQVRKAISKYGYMQKEKALASFDRITAETVSRLGWQQICESENVDVIRANFRMTFETLAARAEESETFTEQTRLNSAKVHEIVSGVAGSLTA